MDATQRGEEAVDDDAKWPVVQWAGRTSSVSRGYELVRASRVAEK